jgi:hypothetical protein
MLAAMCLVVVALSAAGLAAIALSHEITGVDALLLALICLVIGGLFSLFLFFTVKEAMKPAAAPPESSSRDTAAKEK